MFHVVVYVMTLFNVLPIKYLVDSECNVTMPSLLLTGKKPLISLFHIFGSPVIAHK